MTIPPAWGVAGVAVLVAGAWIATLHVQLSRADTALATEKESRAVAVADAASAAAGELQRQISEQARQAQARQEALDEERTRTAEAVADAAAARTAADQLRADARRAASRRCPSASGAADAGSSAPAADAGLLLAQLLGEMATTGAELAAEADRRGIAGSTCERERDSLTTSPVQ